MVKFFFYFLTVHIVSKRTSLSDLPETCLWHGLVCQFEPIWIDISFIIIIRGHFFNIFFWGKTKSNEGYKLGSTGLSSIGKMNSNQCLNNVRNRFIRKKDMISWADFVPIWNRFICESSFHGFQKFFSTFKFW